MQTPKGTVQVPLVDSSGDIIGYSEKMDVHQRGLLHLAFSLMLIRQGKRETEFLLQRRALNKYHSGGLWTNTCCSHPLKHEPIKQAAQRRVGEELGIVTQLKIHDVTKIQYKHKLDNDLYENEFNHLLVASVNNINLNGNPDEVMDIRWWPASEINAGLAKSPHRFTAWFSEVYQHIQQHKLTAIN